MNVELYAQKFPKTNTYQGNAILAFAANREPELSREMISGSPGLVPY